ncbi:DUF2793 domain-containing protein [Pseudooceanicola sp. C21-150M6]|uniref:DUF2793 domain-containing protein n=1 Tax=Pseudooceanicola sp. C21-150M6 TaxID=3434355 RepID=UPI003D7F4D02
MSDLSARLGLPLIQPSQAQKHVTHNEALLLIDLLLQTGVQAFDQTDPPATPATGAVYGLGLAPNGAWAGQGGALAMWLGEGWLFAQPQPGWRAWDMQNSRLMVFSATEWSAFAPDLSGLTGIGVNATWDSSNRFALASDASLFNHDGAGHQLKINKAAVGDTASLLFQSGFTGHAEMGLAGDRAFSLKVSDDGSTWVEALRADAGAGTVTLNLPLTGPAVQQSADDATPGRLMRSDYGYGPGTVLGTVSESGGTPTGALIETGQGANGRYARWADGTQICWLDTIDVSGTTSSVLTGSWSFPATFAAAPVVSMTLNTSSADWSGVAQGDLSCWGAENAVTTGVTLAAHLATGATPVTATIAGNAAMAMGRWF